MSDKTSSEIIIDADGPDKPSQTGDSPVRKLSFQTKFFCAVFILLLIYHFFSSWSSSARISDLNASLTDANKNIKSLELQNQKLSLKLQSLEDGLKETKSNLKYVEGARQDKIEEARKLNDIIEGFKKNLNEGSKLEIKRLEGKIQEWEKYLESIQDLLKTRPAETGN